MAGGDVVRRRFDRLRRRLRGSSTTPGNSVTSSNPSGNAATSDMPVPNAPTAVDYGRQATGDAGVDSETVQVKTAAELVSALCSKIVGGNCVDDSRRIIEVAGTIDFTGTEGAAQVAGCTYSSCSAPWKPELLALLLPNDTHCSERNLPTYEITYDKAGVGSMLVGSNKTLIGVGSAGVIKGKGLLLVSGVSNIIIRNLTFSDINSGIIFAGDAIKLGNTDRVWIDHNRFVRIARQMLVTGWQDKGASNVTVSWNEFDGRSEYPARCDGKHYWNMLLNGKNDSITFFSNWIHDFSGRGPDIHGANQIVHFVNNYFQGGSWYAIDPGATASALLEGNYFQNVVQPILNNPSHGLVFAPVGPMSSATVSQCNAALGRQCEPNVSNPMPRNNYFTLDLAVLNRITVEPRDAIASPYGVSKVPLLVPNQAGPGHLGSASL
jgi:pectin lyase